MPIYRRLPKRGFSNVKFAKNYTTVSVGRIQTAIDAKKLDAKKPVNAEALIEAGVVRRALDGIRILSDGELKAKVSCEAAGASKAAIAKIEKAGGSVSILVAAEPAVEKAPKAKPKKEKAAKEDAEK